MSSLCDKEYFCDLIKNCTVNSVPSKIHNLLCKSPDRAYSSNESVKKKIPSKLILLRFK